MTFFHIFTLYTPKSFIVIFSFYFLTSRLCNGVEAFILSFGESKYILFKRAQLIQALL